MSGRSELEAALDRLSATGAARMMGADEQLRALRPCEYDWLDESERAELYRVQCEMREHHWADVRRAREKIAARRANRMKGSPE